MHKPVNPLLFGDKRLPPRFWEKVSADEADGCWKWLAAKSKGYGVFVFEGRRHLAHRLIYTVAHRDPGSNFVLHHCDNPACINPHHLFEGDQLANMQDMAAKGRWRGNHAGLAKTHCVRGHQLSGGNLRFNKKGHRVCRACMSIHYRNWSERVGGRYQWEKSK